MKKLSDTETKIKIGITVCAAFTAVCGIVASSDIHSFVTGTIVGAAIFCAADVWFAKEDSP